jgi:hypothetical protein
LPGSPKNIGADIGMTDLLAHLAGDCRLWDSRNPGIERCGAYFEDLASPPTPPDLPPPLRWTLRVVSDGKE